MLPRGGVRSGKEHPGPLKRGTTTPEKKRCKSISEHELRAFWELSDGESNPGLPRFVERQAEIMTVRPSKMCF